ncbi:MAG: carbamate kinase [Oscillospiraceae bacterium]
MSDSLRIVVALGGNALGATLPEQMIAVRNTVRMIADLIEDGHKVVITHGNGPQVGMISQAMTELSRNHPQHPLSPMSICVAMSQGYIGYDIQNFLTEELLRRGIYHPVVTIITQVEVDPNDPAFFNPTKPIGAFMTRGEADEMVRRGNPVIEDAGRGWRRVVASPRPIRIIELASVRALLDKDQVVVACGGGGIPVAATSSTGLRGVGAVIDKDLASARLAIDLGADRLIILTAVEKVSINFGKPDEKPLAQISTADAKRYIAEGHFAPGSMLPKMEAVVQFAESGEGRSALITHLQTAREGLAGKTGTIVTK